MSTMKKRIPMFLLALAMMVAMALPTFALSSEASATSEFTDKVIFSDDSEQILRASRTYAASRKATKTYWVTTNEGETISVPITYTVSGNYVKDLNTGLITSAYGTKIDPVAGNIKDVGGHSWRVNFINWQTDPAKLSSDGSKAEFSASVTVTLTEVYGAAFDGQTYTVGTISDTAYAYAG